MPGSIHAHVIDRTRLRVEVISDQGAKLALIGDVTDLEPESEHSEARDGGDSLKTNPALRSNMWAYAKAWYAAHASSNMSALSIADAEEQKAAVKVLEKGRRIAQRQAEAFAKTAQWIADVADDVSHLDVREAWCSSCFIKSKHRKSNRPGGQLPVYVCQACGSATLPCVAIGCPNMAVRQRGAINVPQFCAEHRHDISGFEKAQGPFGELHDYEDYLEYDKPNLDVGVKIAVGSALAVGLAFPLALLAAPAVGGAVGSLGLFGGFSGAAATSHGLALLGGGTLAAGGLGIAGGTAVVTAVGAAVGGALGASVSNAYLREDGSFRIELLRPGRGGVPVVVASGFLSDGKSDKWGNWRTIVDERYPDSPVYRVYWGAKELRDFGVLGANLAGRAGGVLVLKGAAAAANRAAARLLGNVVGPALVAADLAKNPWHVAKNRADKTGVILGDLLARTTTDSYVLIGHSLGARVMVVAAETLGSKAGGPRIQSAHLLGTAIGAKSDWARLTGAVEDAVHGYHSTNDNVLRYVYKTVQAGESAAGFAGFQPASSKLHNIDVTAQVKSHFDYLENVKLV